MDKYRKILYNSKMLIQDIETNFELKIDLDKYRRLLFEHQKYILNAYFNDDLNVKQKRNLKYIYDKYNRLLFEMNTDNKFINRNIISLYYKKIIYKLSKWSYKLSKWSYNY